MGRQRAAETRQAKAASRTADLRPVIDAIRAEGVMSATGIAKALNERGIPAGRQVAGRPGSKASALMTEASDRCLWCGSRFKRRNDGGKAQRFCRPACRRALDAAGRRWIAGALASGALSSGDVRNGSLTTRALLPSAEAQAPNLGGHSAGQSAPVAPPEPPGEAAESSPFTETWEFRAMVAEAVTATLVKAMPRIIVAAVTGSTS